MALESTTARTIGTAAPIKSIPTTRTHLLRPGIPAHRRWGGGGILRATPPLSLLCSSEARSAPGEGEDTRPEILCPGTNLKVEINQAPVTRKAEAGGVGAAVPPPPQSRLPLPPSPTHHMQLHLRTNAWRGGGRKLSP